MATTSDNTASGDRFAGAGDFLLAARPLFALAVVWLTTAGHPMNFREMGIAHGWVPAELYSLQTTFPIAIALALLACPELGRHASSLALAQLGLLLLALASFLNGLFTHAPLAVFVAGRAVAGVGVGLTIYFAPRLLDSRLENPTSWASIALPVIGPSAIAAASMVHGWSDWQWGFLVEGIAALGALVVLLSIASAPEPPESVARGSLAFLPFLVIGSAGLVYCLHWGQLYGWLESTDIVIPGALGALALVAACGLAYPRVDLLALKEGWPRLLLFFFGGACQFLHGTSMNVYGGLLLNLSTWQRSLLIWPLPLGVATSLGVVRLARHRWPIRLGLPGAVAGLLVMAAGMYQCYELTINWPYWQIQNVADLNWFPAPQHWELTPGRFFIGLGIGLFMIAMDMTASRDAQREQRVRPFLLVSQFYGAGIGVATLVNFFLIGHPINYSYAADRDYIQADEFRERQAVLRAALQEAGEEAPDRQAETLLFRFVNYEADNLVFAMIYAAFAVAGLALAALCAGLWVIERLRSTILAQAP
jgi:hypothetical protein